LIRYLKDITSVLIPKEKQYFFLLIAAEVLINLLDIAAVAGLYVIINFYTQPSATIPYFLTGYLTDRNTVLPICIFLLLFCLKNIAGYWISRTQYRFVYAVAARLSQKKLLQYLEGSFSNYIGLDSSVHIKKISQQPIEFAQYVLLGTQQILAQVILISITVMVLLVFNAKLFLLLFIILLPPVILIAYLVKRKAAAAKNYIKESSERSLQYLQEAINGFIESRIYDRNDFFSKRYAQKQQQLSQYLGGIHAVQAMPGRMIEVFAVLGFFILIIVSRFTAGVASPSVIPLPHLWQQRIK
jgi:ABC-type multidrug transport system fused ATPase/permease subunit